MKAIETMQKAASREGDLLRLQNENMELKIELAELREFKRKVGTVSAALLYQCTK